MSSHDLCDNVFAIIEDFSGLTITRRKRGRGFKKTIKVKSIGKPLTGWEPIWRMGSKKILDYIPYYETKGGKEIHSLEFKYWGKARVTFRDFYLRQIRYLQELDDINYYYDELTYTTLLQRYQSLADGVRPLTI